MKSSFTQPVFPHHNSMRTMLGLSLMEIIITMGIIAMLIGFAIPTFYQSQARSAVGSAQQNLLDSITLAQSEALKRGFEVTVCASTDGTSCGTDTGDWTSGWIVLATTDEEGKSLSATAPEALLQVYKAPQALNIFATRTNTTFRSDGTSTPSLGLLVCPSKSGSPIQPKRLFINVAGRILLNSDRVTLDCP